MSLRHWSVFNGASMAQGGSRHRYRRPKGKPMAHWLRLWFFPNGALAQWRTAGGKKSDPLVKLLRRHVGPLAAGAGARVVTPSLAPEAAHEQPSPSPRLPLAGGIRRRKISRAYQPGHWLNEHDALIVKADYQEPLVILRLSLAADIAKKVAA